MSNVEVMEATESFATELDGKLYQVGAGSTRVASDHPLALNFPQHFRPVEEGLSYRTEEATADPDRPRQRAGGRVRQAQQEPSNLPQEPAAERPAQPQTKPQEAAPQQTSGLTSQSIRKETK